MKNGLYQVLRTGLILCLHLACSFAINGQDAEDFNESNGLFCDPSVVGEQRGKGLIISKESSLDQGISTKRTGDQGNTDQEYIDQNSRYSFKLRFPVLNRNNFKWVLGARYETEKFRFKNADELEEPLLIGLQQKPLRKVGLDSYFLKPFKGNKFLILRVKSTLNGDFNADEFKHRGFLRMAGIAAMGWKLSDYRSVGIGVAASQLFGQTTIYPVLFYRHTFSDKFGLEADLPASIKLRYTPTLKQFLYLRVNVDGANYKLVPENISTPFYLEKSELRTSVIFEQEIHDWLWVGMQVGHRYNIAFDVSSVKGLSVELGDRLLDSTVEDTFFYNLSIFIVAPRKMQKK